MLSTFFRHTCNKDTLGLLSTYIPGISQQQCKIQYPAKPGYSHCDVIMVKIQMVLQLTHYRLVVNPLDMPRTPYCASEGKHSQFPSKHEIFSQCWYNFGPSSSTLAQHCTNIA